MIIGYRKLEFFFLEAILFYKKDLIIDDLERLLIDEYIWKKIRPGILRRGIKTIIEVIPGELK